MRHSVVTFPVLSRPTRRKALTLLALAALSTGLVLPRVCGPLSRPPGAHWTTEQAARHMLALGNAYQGSCSLDAAPTYFGDFWVPSELRTHHRRAWAAFVNANGQTLELIVNERTGNPVYVFDGGQTDATTSAPQANASVDTPAQAARVSMQSMSRLGLIPRRAQVALLRKPIVRKNENLWRVTWQVRDQPASGAYEVKIALNQRDGRLMCAANSREQTEYEER